MVSAQANGGRPATARGGLVAYFLIGPTASGKSAAAQWLAERQDADILAADSMQVYRGMDVGTAKPTPEDRARVRHHGLDLTAPDRVFSVGEYRRHALAALRDAASRARTVFVVGGSGLYVKSLTHGLDELPETDPSRAAYWEQRVGQDGVGALAATLRDRAPAWHDALADRLNRRRLIRALALVDAGVTDPPSGWSREPTGGPPVGLAWEPAELAERIRQRVRRMYDGGLMEEAARLRRDYPELSRTAREAIGYAEALDCLEGRCQREQAETLTVQRTRQLAKRQRTWFRGQTAACWIEAAPAMSVVEIADRVQEAWRRHGPTGIVE